MSGQISFMQMFVYYHWNNDKYSPEYSQHNNLEPLSLSSLSPNPVYFSALSQLLKQTSLFTVVGRNAAPQSS